LKLGNRSAQIIQEPCYVRNWIEDGPKLARKLGICPERQLTPDPIH
jgi:hypothetical protein